MAPKGCHDWLKGRVKVLLLISRGAGAFHISGPVELSEHLPHVTSGGMEANDGQLRHVASVYEAD
jgi:hypothetical protein